MAPAPLLQNYQPSATEYDTWNIHDWSLLGVTTLVMGSEEPENLYRFATSGAFARLEWLLFEKGVSQVDYDFQPALLTELPLLGGLAQGSDVTVNEGDPVVDVYGSAVALAAGRGHPACRRAAGHLCRRPGADEAVRRSLLLPPRGCAGPTGSRSSRRTSSLPTGTTATPPPSRS